MMSECVVFWKDVRFNAMHSMTPSITNYSFNQPPLIQLRHQSHSQPPPRPLLFLHTKERPKERVGEGVGVCLGVIKVMDIMTNVTRSGDEDDAGNVSCFRTGETLIRLLPLGLCVAALVLMLKNSESNDYGSLSYSDLGAFRYLVHANGVCAAYSLLSAIFSAKLQSSKPRAWTFFLLDQVLTYVILAAGAVACEVLYLEHKGDDAVTWSEACGSYGKFCHKATASVAMTFVSVLIYAGLSLISSYRLFSKYDAPVCYHTGKGIENPVFQG